MQTPNMRSNWCSNVVFGGGAAACEAPPSPRATSTLFVVMVGLTTCGVSAPVTVRYGPPVVASLAPEALPTAGGATVVVRGVNFEAGTRVCVARACDVM